MARSRLLLAVMSLGLAACARRPAVEIREVCRAPTPGWAHDVSLESARAYVSDREGGMLVYSSPWGLGKPEWARPVRDVISLSPNSGSPVLAARFEGIVAVSPSGQVTDRYSNGDIANAVEVRDGRAFAAYGLHGLVVASLKPRIRCLATLPSPGWSHDLRLSRNQALVADWNYGLRVVDISTPDHPAEIASLPSPATTISLCVEDTGGRRLVALAEGHGGVGLAELDAAGRPRPLGRHFLGLHPGDRIHPESGGWVHSIAWAGHYLLAANWKKGVAVLDAADPGRPRLVLEVRTRGTALGVKAQRQPDGSHLVFLADGEGGFAVYQFRAAR